MVRVSGKKCKFSASACDEVTRAPKATWWTGSLQSPRLALSRVRKVLRNRRKCAEQNPAEIHLREKAAVRRAAGEEKWFVYSLGEKFHDEHL